MFKTALVPNAPVYNLSRNELGVFPRLLIPSKFIAVRIGRRSSPAQNEVAKNIAAFRENI